MGVVNMKKHSTVSSARPGIEKLAKQRRVKAVRRREDLYRHSVHDTENLDDWLKHLGSLRLEGATGGIRKS